jgi:predicted exporter
MRRAVAVARLFMPWLWLLVVLAVAAHQWRFWHRDGVETDLFALLPSSEREAGIERATRQLADAAARQLVVVVGAADWESARRAAERFAADWQRLDPGLDPASGLGAAEIDGAMQTLAPWRNRLVPADQIERIERTPVAALAQQALVALHQPGMALRLSDWHADPLGLWPQWWAQRAAQSPLRPRDGWLTVGGGGAVSAPGQAGAAMSPLEWIVLARQLQGKAFGLDGSRPHGDAIDSAQALLLAAQPGAVVLRAGVPLHAEAAASLASREINTIGWGSLAAVLLLVWLGFRSLRPIVCVALSLLIGTAVALTVTALVFGKVHLVTLVFGASLVGVAEDFGIHYFASRADSPQLAPRALMDKLWPGMALALATSVVGYAVLALVPFPGLRQMALFSSVGLIAAFITVDAWFPALAGRQRAMTPLAEQIAATLRWRPTPPRSLSGWAIAVFLLLLGAAGLMRLQGRDDLRQLQSSPVELLASQRQVQDLLRWPSPGQFFLVSADDEQGLLQREEALTASLARLRQGGLALGWTAVSDWVPSMARQRRAADLLERVEPAVVAAVGAALDEQFERLAPPQPPALLPQTLLGQRAGAALRGLWLGQVSTSPPRWASVVLLSGLNATTPLDEVARAGDGLAGVRWVDRVAGISALLARYRTAMSALLVAGFIAVAAALWLRFRADAWRALLPSVLATMFSLAVLGWLGEPLQLFNVLALILLLGIGVDYGIFLVEHRGERSAWLAVVLGAASTWLSFGLLSLSATPALHAFGLTMALGVAAVTVMSPMFLDQRPARDGR